MNFLEQLKSRKSDWSRKPHLASLDSVFSATLPVVTAVSAKRQELVARGTLSEKGIADELKQYVDGTITPFLADARARVKKVADDVEAKRSGMKLPKPDSTDISAAMLRQEMRAYLRGLSHADRAKVLMDNPDPAMVTAALEAPSALSGMTDEMRHAIEESHLAVHFAGQVAEINETEEALALVSAAIQGAENDLVRNAR